MDRNVGGVVKAHTDRDPPACRSRLSQPACWSPPVRVAGVTAPVRRTGYRHICVGQFCPSCKETAGRTLEEINS